MSLCEVETYSIRGGGLEIKREEWKNVGQAERSRGRNGEIQFESTMVQQHIVVSKTCSCIELQYYMYTIHNCVCGQTHALSTFFLISYSPIH